jgi:hypothetical protein
VVRRGVTIRIIPILVSFVKLFKTIAALCTHGLGPRKLMDIKIKTQINSRVFTPVMNYSINKEAPVN